MAKDKKTSSSRRVARAGRHTRVTEKMQIGAKRGLLNRTAWLWVLAAAGAIIIISGGLSLYYTFYADPQRVFNDMITNNLATRGYSKEMIRPAGHGGSSDESIQLNFTPNIRVKDVRQVVIPASATKVTIETIGTPTADYQRYTKIDRKSSSGKKLDYNRVYSLWVKNGEGTGGDAQLINSAFFGATLFGNLQPANRQEVVQKLKAAYIVDYKHVLKQSSNHRRTYTYVATVYLRQYAAAAKLYAHTLGLPIANQINPEAYTEATRLEVVMTVDVLSRQLSQVQYINQGLTETYSGYGTAPDINVPAKTVPAQNLNQLLNSIQSD
jgi:hypothetical protein